MNLVKIIGILSIGVSVTLLGASSPQISDVVRDIKVRKEKNIKTKLPKIKKHISKKQKKDIKDERRVYIKDIKVLNAIHLSKKEIERIIKPYKNKNLNFKQMQEIAQKLTLEDKKRGYFVARAYIPKQNLIKQKNVLMIKVVEGKFDKIKIKNTSLVKNSIIEARLENIKDRTINMKRLESALLKVEALNGSIIKNISLSSGSKLGTSDIKISLGSSKRVNGYLVVDNYGSKFIGKYKGTLGVIVNSPLNIGDKLSVYGLLSTQGALKNVDVDYSFPLYKNGLNGSIGYAKTNYDLIGSAKAIDARGEANSIYAKISYPFLLKEHENSTLYTKYKHMGLEDKVSSAVTQKLINSVKIGFDYSITNTWFNQGNIFNINTYFTLGHLRFKGKQQKNQKILNTQGNFTKINIDLSNMHYFNNKYFLNTNIQLQKAFGRNLDGVEDLSLGGTSAIRVATSSGSSAENGFVVQNELYYNLPIFKIFNSRIGVFHDIGKVFAQNNVTNFQAKILQDMGLLVKINTKHLFSTFTYAKKVGSSKATSVNNDDNKFLFQIGWSF